MVKNNRLVHQYFLNLLLDRGINQNAPASKICDHPGCQEEGIHRAPKSRHNLQNASNDWYWFCLEHIRIYNGTWNYYSNMSEMDQLQDRIDDTVGQRPTWPLGYFSSSKTTKNGMENSFNHAKDPFGFFEKNASSPNQKPVLLSKDQKGAIILFDLAYPFSHEELLKRYRILAKLHHPDANNNSLQANESFRKIGEAYRILLGLLKQPKKK